MWSIIIYDTYIYIHVEILYFDAVEGTNYKSLHIIQIYIFLNIVFETSNKRKHTKQYRRKIHIVLYYTYTYTKNLHIAFIRINFYHIYASIQGLSIDHQFIIFPASQNTDSVNKRLSEYVLCFDAQIFNYFITINYVKVHSPQV